MEARQQAQTVVDEVLRQRRQRFPMTESTTIAGKAKVNFGYDITLDDVNEVLFSYERQGKVRLARPMQEGVVVTEVSEVFLEELMDS